MRGVALGNGAEERVAVSALQDLMQDIGMPVPRSGRWDGMTRAGWEATLLIANLDLHAHTSVGSRWAQMSSDGLDALQRFAVRWSPRPDAATLLDLAESAERVLRLSSELGEQLRELAAKDHPMTERIAGVYQEWLERGDRVLAALRDRVLSIGPILQSLSTFGISEEEVQEALSGVPRPSIPGLSAASNGALTGLPAVIIVGVLITVILAVGFGGFALATGELSALQAELMATLRTAFLVVGSILGVDPEAVGKSADRIEPEKATGSGLSLWTVAGVGALAIGGIALWRWLRRGGATRFLPEEDAAVGFLPEDEVAR